MGGRSSKSPAGDGNVLVMPGLRVDKGPGCFPRLSLMTMRAAGVNADRE